MPSRDAHLPASQDVLALLVRQRPVEVIALDAVAADASGILHLANEGEITWYGLAREIASAAGLDTDLVNPITSAGLDRPARRPRNSVLDSERSTSLGIPPLPAHKDTLTAALSSTSA